VDMGRSNKPPAPPVQIPHDAKKEAGQKTLARPVDEGAALRSEGDLLANATDSFAPEQVSDSARFELRPVRWLPKPAFATSLRTTKRYLVIDGVEGVLRPHLVRLNLAVPNRSGIR
jgi:hypothetical protein